MTFVDPAIGRSVPSCSSDERTARLPGARGAQHGAERQELPFGMAVEASALCEMEEALRVRFTFRQQQKSHDCAPAPPRPAVFPAVNVFFVSPSRQFGSVVHWARAVKSNGLTDNGYEMCDVPDSFGALAIPPRFSSPVCLRGRS